MTLQLDLDTGKIIYRGKIIGEFVTEAGKIKVRFSLEYEADPDIATVPLGYLSMGLAKLPENRIEGPSITIETNDESIEEEFHVPRSINEKIVTIKNHNWIFHKSDPDTWPSPLHGHEYDRQLKLDAITGEIYDTGTRQKCAKLKPKILKRAQDELRSSRDFAEKVRKHIDKKQE